MGGEMINSHWTYLTNSSISSRFSIRDAKLSLWWHFQKGRTFNKCNSAILTSRHSGTYSSLIQYPYLDQLLWQNAFIRLSERMWIGWKLSTCISYSSLSMKTHLISVLSYNSRRSSRVPNQMPMHSHPGCTITMKKILSSLLQRVGIK